MAEAMKEQHSGATRRDVFRLAGGLAAAGAAVVIMVRPARSTPTEMQAAITKVVGDARIHPGKVKLELPPLVENGNTVACSVSVESPMTPTDYCKAIHIFNEHNPQPNVVSVYLGPRAGRASISTRIRLSDTQKVVAIGEMNDGSFWSDTVEVIVTLGACLEEVRI